MHVNKITDLDDNTILCVCVPTYVCVSVCLQHLIAEKCVPILHKLEQVSSDKHVGTLAENLLDALRDDPAAAQKVAIHTTACT